ncbi:unnamed protein product [Caenorhabditis bovis]|uniref:Lipase n=1 Tax=Caenorhabditis bovis TaxID=2654633 RepID=A0A8S1EDE4_9PELO|nr:unnamed protein product [Caenorhabditis bovis]
MIYFDVLVLIISYYSTNAYDAEIYMTTNEIIERWGYSMSIHTVTTNDGYILEMHRISEGKNNSIWKNGRKPVVFMQHALLCSSSDWVINLPHQSAAFMFADAGFDVWLGNSRGNVYSKKHRNLDPSSAEYWDFSWDEMAKYDLEAMINKVLKVTGESSIYYIGHSQGTLTMFSRLADDDGKRFAPKIRKLFALAPVMSVKNIKGLFRFIAQNMMSLLDAHYRAFGSGEFLAKNWISMGKYLCATFISKLCDSFIFVIAGPESSQWNSTRVPVYVSQAPAGTSTKNILHWMQLVNNGRVAKFDYGAGKNLEKYGHVSPPAYNFSNIQGTRIHIYWSDSDYLADSEDVTQYILKSLNPDVLEENIHLSGFNHLDFTWGLRAADEIYKPIIQTCTDDYKNSINIER